MKNKKRGLAILLSLTGLFATVGTSLAYWASSVSGNTANTTGTVNVGTGQAVTTEVVVSNFTAGKVLVPSGEVVNTATETDSVAMIFPVEWNSVDGDATGAVGTLTVAKTGLTVDGGADTYNLVNVLVPGAVSITADDPALNVTVTVTLNTPANITEYNSVAGKPIVISFSFTVA